MSALVTDTHSAIWYLLPSPRLSPAAKRVFDEAAANGEPIYVSAITLIEMAYLIEKGRLPESDIQALTNELQNPSSSFELVPIDLNIARALRLIPRADVPDMPDRIIAATALHLGLPLVTRDSKIRAANLTTVW